MDQEVHLRRLDEKVRARHAGALAWNDELSGQLAGTPQCVCRRRGRAWCPASLFHDSGGWYLTPDLGSHLDYIDITPSKGALRGACCYSPDRSLSDWRERAGHLARRSVQPHLTSFLTPRT